MPYISIVLLALVRLAVAAPIICSNGFHTLVYREYEFYKDEYTYDEEIADFWNRHDRFGVVREKGRLILIAKDDAIASQLLADLGGPKGAKKVQRKKVGGAAYDITDLADPLAVKYVGRWAFDGPNCWNLCLLHREITAGVAATRDEEFTHWMASPLAKEITRVEDLKKGDVVAFRKNGGEVHGAIYVSPRILLTKNGTEEVRPYRLMDLNEVYNIYRPSSDDIKLFRVTPLPEFLASRPGLKTPELSELMGKIDALEKRINVLAMQDDAEKQVDNDAYQEMYRKFPRELKRTAGELYAKAEADLAKVTDPDLQSIYKGLMIRLRIWNGRY